MHDERTRALGLVPVTGRGRLPFALLRGESLVACAASALGEAGVELLDGHVEWQQLRLAGRPLVLHDPLCPATPAELIARAVALAEEHGDVVVACRGVTDTVKRVLNGRVCGTVDRDGLRQVVSPLVLPTVVVAALDDPPDLDDFAELVGTLGLRWRVRWLEAPALAGRIGDEAELRVLAGLSDGLGG